MKKLSIAAALLFAFGTVTFAQDKAADKKAAPAKTEKKADKKATKKTETKKADKKAETKKADKK